MSTIQEFEIRLKANLMKTKFLPDIQWKLIEEVQNVVKETIKEIGMDSYLSTYSKNSSVFIYPRYDYVKNYLGVSEDISRRMISEWYFDGFFAIKVKKTKDKNKMGRQHYQFKDIEISLDNKSISFDELAYKKVEIFKQEIKERRDYQQEIINQRKKELEDFIQNVLIPKGINPRDFDDFFGQYYQLICLLNYRDKEEVLKKFSKEEL